MVFENKKDLTLIVKKRVEEINRTIHLTTMFTPLYLMCDIRKDGSMVCNEHLEYDRKLAYSRILASHDKANSQCKKKVKADPVKVGSIVS
eukprot:g7284.t1